MKADWQDVDADVVQIQNEYYIRATSSRADDRTRVLKDEDLFAVFDRFGDIHAVGTGEQGLYFRGTRFLSRHELRLGGRRPFLLSSAIKEDNDLFIIDLSNPDIVDGNELSIERGVLHIERSQFLSEGTFHERITVRNYGRHPVTSDLGLRFDADFADIFEVRGSPRPRRGHRHPTTVDRDQATLCYQGLDGVLRHSQFRFSPAPEELTTRAARFALALEAGQTFTLEVAVTCQVGEPRTAPVGFASALHALSTGISGRAVDCSLHSSNAHFDHWLCRSSADLRMMTTATPHGPYPYAGVPWFSTVFGRDGIITALECLWWRPDIAAGVLRTLAAMQADSDDPARDAQPGKILHEWREGEMAALGEVPFGLYYGSVDATPLYVWLAGEYLTYTGDLALIETLWPNLERALTWIETYGDPDRDGFVEYARRTPGGLDQQGWKDSNDSVFHADGHLAEPPIALVEVQAYVYAAYRAAAHIAHARGRDDEALGWHARAERLAQAFDEHFWDDELGTYVLALDGHKRPCRVVTSNAGHALATGIARPERAAALARTLLSPRLHCGWGVRTLAEGESRYNPMSYHNGSVWPHDNALIAHGLRRYGQTDAVLQLMTGFFEASAFFEMKRLPELFCGFESRFGEGPTLYPVACSPQAWASGAVYMLLGACLGLQVDGRRHRLSLSNPALPAFLERLTLRNLRAGEGARVDVQLQRHPHDVGVTVLGRQGPVRVVVER